MKRIFSIFVLVLFLFIPLVYSEEEPQPEPQSSPEPQPEITQQPEPQSSPEPQPEITQQPENTQSQPAQLQPQNPPEGCYIGNQQVPCPEQGPSTSSPSNLNVPQILPQGCHEETDESGFIRTVCESKQINCPKQDKSKVESCEKEGGRIIKRDYGGCLQFECEFGNKGGLFEKCPPKEEIEGQIKKCESNNLRPIIDNQFGCPSVRCESDFMGNCKTIERIPGPEREECESKGDFRLVEIFNEGDKCPKIECLPEEAAKVQICRREGGNLISKKDDQGNVVFSECVRRGKEDSVKISPIEKMPPYAKLISVVTKLDRLNMQFENIAKELKDLSDYYKSNNQNDIATRYEKASNMLLSARNKIDEMKQRLKQNLDNLDESDIEELKHDLVYLNEVIFKDVLYLMLEGDITSYKSEEVKSEDGYYEENVVEYQGNECGSDGRCFDEKLRTCEENTVFDAESDTKIIIKGLKDSNCIIYASSDTPMGLIDMECSYPNYAFGLKGPEELIPYCQGKMVEFIKNDIEQGNLGEERTRKYEQIKKAEPMQTINRFEESNGFGEPMMGCEKVEKGINPKDVCGNECCEGQYGESYENCPKDCMPSKQEVLNNQQGFGDEFLNDENNDEDVILDVGYVIKTLTDSFFRR